MSAPQLKLKLRPVPLQPMTANGYIPDMPSIAALILQNTGDSTVRIFDGMWTVLPNGGTLAINVTEDMASMDVLQLDVVFTGGTTNRLEILTLRMGAQSAQLNC